MKRGLYVLVAVVVLAAIFQVFFRYQNFVSNGYIYRLDRLTGRVQIVVPELPTEPPTPSPSPSGMIDWNAVAHPCPTGTGALDDLIRKHDHCAP
jgi:hypothetical protein